MDSKITILNGRISIFVQMRIPSNKINDVVRFFRDELKDLYDKEELETFIAYCFEEFVNIKRIDIALRGADTISESELLKFNFAIKDLKKNKPIQYILGKADFFGLKFIVNEYVLIPRQETEELVKLVIKEIQESRFKNQDNLSSSTLISILDVGTGSGCIPIVLKNKIPSAKVYSIDISEKAIEIAKQNAKSNAVDVEFIQHDILSEKQIVFSSEIKFDIIVSNPPYIREFEKKQMHKNVLDYEPHIALFVNDDEPLLFYKAIADFAIKQLNPNGKIYFEINEVFGLETKEMLENKGFKNVSVVKDINDKNRILRANI